MRSPDRIISPEHLALTGILALPALLFGGALWVKVILAALYICLSLLSGRRVRVLPNLFVAIGIIASHLITPIGRIYFRLGAFPVTEGALRLGVLKAATIIGLVYLSRLTVRATIRLPGRAGEVFSLMLFYFERITEQKIRLRRGEIWKSLDELLDAVFHSAVPGEGRMERQKSRLPGLLAAGVFLFINWSLFALGELIGGV